MRSEDRARDDLLEKIEHDRLVIPPVPAVYEGLTALLRDADAGANEVGEMVAKDPPLTGLVLRVANSARYGPQEKVVSVDKACVMVGARGLKNLVIQVGARRSFEHLRVEAAGELAVFWRHAQLTARLAVRIQDACEFDHSVDPELLYSCGLLHDIGQLVLLDALGDEYVELLHRARKTGEAMVQLERERCGYGHTEVGALLARTWKLPEEIETALGHHHDSAVQCLRHPWLALTDLSNRLGNALDHAVPPAAWTFLDPLTAQRLGLHVSRIPELLEWGAAVRVEIAAEAG